MLQWQPLMVFMLFVIVPLLIYLAMPSKEKVDTQPENNEPGFKHLVNIASFPNSVEAHIVKGRLESAGIEAHLANDVLSSLYSPVVLVDGGIQLRVKDADAEAARKLLASQQLAESSN